MPHPLQTKVRHIARLARGVLWLRGVAWVVGSVVAMGLCVGVADWLMRSEDPGVRIILSAGVLVAAGVAAWRFLWPVAARRLGEVEVAQRIERRFPELKDRLSSSLEFLGQSEEESTAGSPTLRRTVVAEATAMIDGLPLADVVNLRRPLPVAGAAAGVLLVIVVLLLFAPQAASQAARRMLIPWSNDPWPRLNDLAFVDPPHKVPFGEPFQVELVDRNDNLPGIVKIYYQFEGQQQESVVGQDMKPAGDKMVHTLNRVSQPFRFRAAGGDDDTMPWISVEVVQPPRLESLSLMLHPPDYTGWPAQESTPHIKALAGTTVSLSGRSSKPLSKARIVVDAGEEEAAFEAKITDDGRGFELGRKQNPWTLAESGGYRIELTGADGVTSGGDERYQLQVVPDAPPRVSLDSPETHAFVTAGAVVQIAGSVKDDLAIERIELRFSRSDQSEAGEEIVVLYQGPEKAVALGDAAATLSGEGETQAIKHAWDLAKLPHLGEGTSLLLTVAAADYRPQQEISTPRRITIITDDQLQDRIDQRQSFLLGQLAEALNLQRESRAQTSSLQIQLLKAGKFEKTDLVDLQAAELNQRQIGRLLAGEQDGVLAQIDALEEVLDNNRVDNPGIRRRLESLRAGVREITTGPLPSIQRDLISTLKTAQLSQEQSKQGGQALTPALSQSERESLEKIAVGQDDVIARLEQMLGRLSQWDSYRRFARDISQLRRDQDAVSERTADQRAKTLSKDVQQLSPQEQADLAKLAQRQSELARRLDRTLAGMDQMSDELQPADPLAAEALDDAIDTARRLGLSARIRQAGREIESNQLGHATGNQEQISKQLKDVMDALAGRKEHELGRLVEKLKEAAGELDALQQRQKGLLDKMNQAAETKDELQRRRKLERLEAERQEQEEKLRQLARRLERLQAESAAEHLRQSAQQLGQAGEAADQGDSAGQQQAGDLAEKQLEQAQQQLQQAIRQAEQQLLQEQFAKLEQALEGMTRQQQSIIDETVRLEEKRGEQGELTRGQQASVRTLARQQRGLVSEAGDFAEKIAEAEAFYLGLTGAMREMSLAAAQLDTENTGGQTQQLERNALARLEQLVAALKQNDAQAEEDSSSGGGTGGQQGGPAGDGIQHVAQLKLLRLMQDALRQRTAQLDKIMQESGKWTDEEQAEVARLAEEQGSLAELIFNLGQPAEENPEDDPESLPGGGEADSLDEDLEKAIEDAIK